MLGLCLQQPAADSGVCVWTLLHSLLHDNKDAIRTCTGEEEEEEEEEKTRWWPSLSLLLTCLLACLLSYGCIYRGPPPLFR